MLRKPYQVIVHESYEIDKRPKITFKTNYKTIEQAEYVAREISDYTANLYGTNYVEVIERETNEVLCEFVGEYAKYCKLPCLTKDIILKIEKIYKAE